MGQSPGGAEAAVGLAPAVHRAGPHAGQLAGWFLVSLLTHI